MNFRNMKKWLSNNTYEFIDSKLRAEMASKAGKTSVPQIWFGEKHIGGCDDLHTLHNSNNLLDALA